MHLDEIVPGRKCPECGAGPILESRRWVIYVDGACCLSCWRKAYVRLQARKNALAHAEEVMHIVAHEQRSFLLKPGALARARQRAGLGQRDLAAMCGWTRAVLRRIEDGATLVTEQQLRGISEALLQRGVVIDVPTAQTLTEAPGRLDHGAGESGGC